MKQTGWSRPALVQAESAGGKLVVKLSPRLKKGTRRNQETGQTRDLPPGSELTPPKDYPNDQEAAKVSTLSPTHDSEREKIADDR